MACLLLLAGLPGLAHAAPDSDWPSLPSVAMSGGLAAYWNVTDRSKGENGNDAGARSRGFRPVTILNTYADYPGNQRESIENFLGKTPNNNPWRKPPFFEAIIRRNIALAGTTGTFVHDIEFDFEEDSAKVWQIPDVRSMSGITDAALFDEAYFKEWATWYSLPARWAREKYPASRIGIYGPQPFRRDYWGIAGKDAQQIDGTHKTDWRLWKYIDPHVDFYIASIYVFYPEPDSVFYMAANVEENYLRTRRFGNKPVYAYEWLRYHDSNPTEANRELDPFLVEAMAILPYFSGARAVVLWGFEPKVTRGDGRLYKTLPLYMQSLNRVAGLSDAIGRGRLEIDEPAHVSWRRRAPLVRRIVAGPAECVIMVINPWQDERSVSQEQVRCGEETHSVTVRGRQTTLTHISAGKLTSH